VGRLKARLRTVAEIALVVGALLVGWEYAAPAAAVPDYVLPLPSVIGKTFWRTLPAQMEHLRATATTTIAGLALALAIGIALALLTVYVKRLNALIVPALAAFNGIPKVAVAPLFVIWFGLDDEPKILLAFLMALFPVFVGAGTGLGDIDPDLLAMARLAGGNELRIFRKVRLMHALPYLTDAVKVAFPLALVGSVVGEFIGGNRGVGYLIMSAQFNLDTPLVFACLLTITLFTSGGVGVIAAIESAWLGWRPSRRKEVGWGG
jgi:NitT/TauT family transport system permease protein